MVLQIVFHTEFSLLPRGLEHFAESNSFPQNQPSIFHPILNVKILLKFILLLFVLLFQQSHLFPTGENVDVRWFCMMSRWQCAVVLFFLLLSFFFFIFSHFSISLIFCIFFIFLSFSHFLICQCFNFPMFSVRLFFLILDSTTQRKSSTSWKEIGKETPPKGDQATPPNRREEKSATTKGWKGKQHVAKAEGENSNTTRKKRTPSSTTHQKRGRERCLTQRRRTKATPPNKWRKTATPSIKGKNQAAPQQTVFKIWCFFLSFFVFFIFPFFFVFCVFSDLLMFLIIFDFLSIFFWRGFVFFEIFQIRCWFFSHFFYYFFNFDVFF